jgi:hypothetical protein
MQRSRKSDRKIIAQLPAVVNKDSRVILISPGSGSQGKPVDSSSLPNKYGYSIKRGYVDKGNGTYTQGRNAWSENPLRCSDIPALEKGLMSNEVLFVTPVYSGTRNKKPRKYAERNALRGYD